MHTVAENDAVSIYRLIGIYNHPPMMSMFLLFLNKILGASDTYFPLLMRIPAILADIGNSLLVFLLAKEFMPEKKAMICGLLVAFSPVLVMVSGFHGNTDPVFICLILLSLYVMLVKKHLLLAGFVFGCAFNIKIVPLICVPAFFFICQNWKSRIQFFSTMLIPLFLGFAYNLIKDSGGIITNVFLYKSLLGNWGFTKLLSQSIALNKLDSVLKIYILLFISISSYLLAKQAQYSQQPDKIRLAAFNSGLTFLIFLALTPGFSVQYLSWLAPTAIFLGIELYMVYSLLGGIFLFSVYTFWSGGFPWDYADSLTRGTWRGFSETMDVILWLFLCIWLIVLLVRVARPFVKEEVPLI
ncbi:hypothetical protein GCM10027442_16730 [Emticicia fontis]